MCTCAVSNLLYRAGLAQVAPLEHVHGLFHLIDIFDADAAACEHLLLVIEALARSNALIRKVKELDTFTIRFHLACATGDAILELLCTADFHFSHLFDDA